MTPSLSPLPHRPYAGAPVLVLGAAGFIGRWVARALTAAGARLTLADRHRETAEAVLLDWDARGEVVGADLADPAALRAVVEAARPAITFNLAGYGVRSGERDETAAERVNAALPASLAEAIAAAPAVPWAGTRLVHVGSAYEYGAIGGDLAEGSEPRPVTLYGRTKLEGTRRLAAACEACGLRGLTARLFMVYGPGEPAGRLLPSLIAAARDGQPLDLTPGTQRRDFTFVGDVAEGLLRLGLAPAPPGTIVNLATGRLAPIRAFAETAGRVLGIPPGHLRFGALPIRAEEMAHDDVNIDRLRALCAWTPPTGMVEGIERTAAVWKRSLAGGA